MPDLKTYIRRLESAREEDEKAIEESLAALTDLYRKNSGFSRPELAKLAGENPATLNLRMATIRKNGVEPGHSRDAKERQQAWENALAVLTKNVAARENVRKTREARNRAIRKAHLEGTTVAEIAKATGITWSRVQQIIRAYNYHHEETHSEEGAQLYPAICKAIQAEEEVHQLFSQMMELNSSYTRQDIAAAFAWGYNRLQTYYKNRPKAVITDELKENPPTLEQVTAAMENVEKLWDVARDEALSYLEKVQKETDQATEKTAQTRRALAQAWADARSNPSFRAGARDRVIAEKAQTTLSNLRSYINIVKGTFQCTPNPSASSQSEVVLEDAIAKLYQQAMADNAALAKARDNRATALRVLLELLENHRKRILQDDISEKLRFANKASLYHMRTNIR